MWLVGFKLVLIVLTAALVLVWRSSEYLAAPTSFTTSTAHAEKWSPASFTAAAKAAVDSVLTSFLSSNSTSSLTSAAATTLKPLLRTEGGTTTTTTTTTTNANSTTASSGVAAEGVAAAEGGGSKKVHKLCVLSRIHNQPRSLAEWLEYHAALGISRFYLVDDCSADGGRTRTVMDIYEQEGLVKYYTPEDVTRSRCAHVIQGDEAEMARAEERRRRRLCGKDGGAEEPEETLDAAAARFDEQMASCEYACGGQHRPNEKLLFEFMFREATTAPDETCEWLMVFDTDEYMTFQTDLFPTPDVPAYIADFEDRTHGFPILRFLWVMMGSDGQEDRPPGLLVDNFKKGGYPKWMLKTAGKVDFLQTWKFSHWPAVKHVSNETSVQEHGFEIPPPFTTLQEFTERNWQTEQPGKGTELRLRNVTRPDTEETMECLYPAYGVFLKHYSWRSFEEFKAHRSQSRVKSDGQGNNPAVDDPHGTWQQGTNPGNFGSPCNEAYFNDFTASMADKTREGLAVRAARWNEAHQAAAPATPDDDYEAWIKAGECGTGPRQYSGAFPPVEAWIIR